MFVTFQLQLAGPRSPGSFTSGFTLQLMLQNFSRPQIREQFLGHHHLQPFPIVTSIPRHHLLKHVVTLDLLKTPSDSPHKHSQLKWRIGAQYRHPILSHRYFQSHRQMTNVVKMWKSLPHKTLTLLILILNISRHHLPRQETTQVHSKTQLDYLQLK